MNSMNVETQSLSETGVALDGNNESPPEQGPEDKEKSAATRMKLEDDVRKFLQNKEIAKERNEENKLLLEEIESLFQDFDGDELTISLTNGDLAVLMPKFREREVLDREALAGELQVAKDELKTPFDFSMFTAQGKLTPAMISKHTAVEREIKLSIGRRKPTTRRRRKNSGISNQE
ncbi:hypothetical protein D2Q93_02310 [Alicyclobacillaceae bacterium I2511]|nr:hypothetical protein D2Q93_02310 [Alicyclobacillaceae bacterium I2511]